MGNDGELIYPACNSCMNGVIVYRKSFVGINYRNEITLNVEEHHYQCTSCGISFTTPQQKAVNKRKVEEAYNKSQSLNGWVYGKAI